MDLPSSTPVFRASVGRNRRYRDSAHNLDPALFFEAHRSDPFLVFHDELGRHRELNFKLLLVED
jgi:hypothetical protein